MTNYQDNDIATTPGMAFDKLFLDDHKKDAMPAAAPLSPCPSDDDESSSDSTAAADVVSSLTGKFSNIEHKYKIDARVLGRGHNGSVRESINRITGQKYAVKSIRKADPSVNPGGLLREIKLLQQTEHENIIKLIDVYEDAGYLHLVTDLCEGGELFDKIVEKSAYDSEADMPCFTEVEAARIIHQILTAVSSLHKHGIVHRDLKPENILFENNQNDDDDEESPSIKIVDFGLARTHYGILGEPPMSNIVGTPYYIAPEVLQRKYDKSCDLWSVGVITYILLCGYPPFQGDSHNEVYDAISRGRYRFSSRDWSNSSEEARRFIRGLLRKDVTKRMSVKQALEHPWIVRHIISNDNDDDFIVVDGDRQDISSVEVVFEESSKRDSIICDGIENRIN